MTPSRRDVLAAGTAIATTLLAGCSSPAPQPTGGGSVEVPKADVPVGGGIVLHDSGVVVTQPVEGSFVAFSATCTHQGCLVREVLETGIFCACHGSLFDTADGSPLEGPADEPLHRADIVEAGDSLVVAT